MPTLPHPSRGNLAVAGAAAVAGLAAGLAATAGRKAFIQAAESMTGDWVDILKAEHLMVAEMFEKLEATTNDQGGKRLRLLTKIKLALDKHAFQEENAVYPALKLAGVDGAADALFHDHGEIKTFLHELETSPPDTDAWLERARALARTIEAHVRQEEDEVFPAYRARLSEDEDKKLTALMLKQGARLA